MPEPLPCGHPVSAVVGRTTQYCSVCHDLASGIPHIPSLDALDPILHLDFLAPAAIRGDCTCRSGQVLLGPNFERTLLYRACSETCPNYVNAITLSRQQGSKIVRHSL